VGLAAGLVALVPGVAFQIVAIAALPSLVLWSATWIGTSSDGAWGAAPAVAPFALAAFVAIPVVTAAIVALTTTGSSFATAWVVQRVTDD
jgi:hypothetical protein